MESPASVFIKRLQLFIVIHRQEISAKEKYSGKKGKRVVDIEELQVDIQVCGEDRLSFGCD